MSEYHKCARCGVADEYVDILRNQHLSPYENLCTAALQRELERRDELLRECEPVIKAWGNAALLRRIEEVLKEDK